MLDEPSNGLDPEGIIWIRELLRRLAGEGRTVLVSSHLMNETASFADHLVVLGRGRLLADTPMREFIDARVQPRVRVRTTDATAPHERPRRGTATTPCEHEDGHWTVHGRARGRDRRASPPPTASRSSNSPHEEATLEQAYLDLTAAETEFTARRRRPDHAVQEASTMPSHRVLHSEWIKIRTLRSLFGALLARSFARPPPFSALAGRLRRPADAGLRPAVHRRFFGVNFGQIAAITFGATAVSSEFHGGALRISLAAVPQRGRWFAAKMAAIGVPALAVGLVTAFATLVVGTGRARGRRRAASSTGRAGCAASSAAGSTSR